MAVLRPRVGPHHAGQSAPHVLLGLRGTACASWRVDTLRSRLFKLAGRVNRTVRRIRLCLASTHVFARTLVNLRAEAQVPPG